jgi:hypothetical protein
MGKRLIFRAKTPVFGVKVPLNEPHASTLNLNILFAYCYFALYLNLKAWHRDI